MRTVAEVAAFLDRRYPPAWAAEWDRVGLVLGEPAAPVRRILCAVDCVPQTAAQAIEVDAQVLLVHHPLLLRGVSSVAPTTYQGRIVHQLIKAEVALFVVHTNADVAAPGVSDALAGRFGLTDVRPLRVETGRAAGEGRGSGRVGRLPRPVPLAELAAQAARVLPPTAGGVRAAGDPDRLIATLAVCGGAGDEFLDDAAAAGVDAYLTADLRHHPASAFRSGERPALLDVAHWATERPWFDPLAVRLRTELAIEVTVSDLDTDPWTLHCSSPADASTTPTTKEPRS